MYLPKEILVSPEHETAILKSLANIPAHIQNIFIVTPVVAFRMAIEEEIGLLTLVKMLHQLADYLRRTALGPKQDPWAQFFLSLLIFMQLDALVDDIEDGLTSPRNLPTLRRLLVGLVDLIANQKSEKNLMQGILPRTAVQV